MQIPLKQPPEPCDDDATRQRAIAVLQQAADDHIRAVGVQAGGSAAVSVSDQERAELIAALMNAVLVADGR